MIKGTLIAVQSRKAVGTIETRSRLSGVNYTLRELYYSVDHVVISVPVPPRQLNLPPPTDDVLDQLVFFYESEPR